MADATITHTIPDYAEEFVKPEDNDDENFLYSHMVGRFDYP